jgi:hypothetical protein
MAAWSHMDGVSMGGHKHQIEITLPKEFLELCEHDLVSPEKVLGEFIADLCDITSQHPEYDTRSHISNGPADRDRARAYYDRIHAWRANWFRENVPHLVQRLRDRRENAESEVRRRLDAG